MTDTGSSHREAIYLASRSPRRLDLLKQIGLHATQIPGDTDETRRPGESPESYVRRVAIEKARTGLAGLHEAALRPVLAADTAVVVGDETLGKPHDRESAARMLRMLSGRQHRVLTAVALISGECELSDLSDSRVTFRHLEESEVVRYWLSGEPLGKAGGYAIQGYGALFVAELRGSYSGVMGLPLFETGRLLSAMGIDVVASASRGVITGDADELSINPVNHRHRWR